MTVDDIFSFLMHFRADESLCRGTELWNEVCSLHTHAFLSIFKYCIRKVATTDYHLMYLGQLCIWLLEHECSFKSRILDCDFTNDPTQKETIRAYVQQEVLAYLRVPASTGESDVGVF